MFNLLIAIDDWLILMNSTEGKYALLSCPRDCYDTCRLRAYVEGGKVVRVIGDDGEYTYGLTCPRAAKDVERIYSPARVLYPHIKAGKSFKRIDWESALNVLTSKLRYVLDNYGPQHVLFLEFAGNRGILTRNACRRLWNFLGVTKTDGSICDRNGERALRLTYGSTYGIFPSDIKGLKMGVIWGFNPAVSAMHLWKVLHDIKDMGGYLITIDVRYSETAKSSTSFIKVKPGSDGALALGLAKYFIEHEYVDEEFIKIHTYGFDALKDNVAKYTLDYVEAVTGVSKMTITELAEAMITNKPFSIFVGYGIQRRHGGGEIVRAISLLPALLGIHRGFYYSNSDGLCMNFKAVEGADRWRAMNVVSMEKVGEIISKGYFKLVYVHLCNPVATLPNSSRIVEGFERNDVFVVVHETHWSDTAKIADLVIPAPTFYEKLDLVYSYTHNIIYLNKPVIEPLGESVGEYQIMCEIAKNVAPNNYREICLDPYEIFELAIGRNNLEKLITDNSLEIVTKPRNVYQTYTGKIEFYSTQAEEEGLPPLPSPPDIDEVNPDELILISSAHPHYTHTQFEDVYGPKPTTIHVSPKDAEKLGLRNGDVAEIRNEKGFAYMTVRIDESLNEGVLWTPRQSYTLDGKRINVLISDDVDTYGGSTLNSTRVRIKKLSFH